MTRRSISIIAIAVAAVVGLAGAAVALDIGHARQVAERVFGEQRHPLLRGERNFEEESEEGVDPAEARARPNGITKQAWPVNVQIGAVTNAAAPGWSGETPVSPTADDWEPAIAFDPNGTYAYLLTTRYGFAKACNQCPSPTMWLLRSTDNGATWPSQTYLCACSGVKAQNDPQIEVASDGSVYAVWMNDYTPGVVFARSTDHGATWTAPVAVKTKAMRFTDKPILAISANGRDVYIAFNSSDSYVVASHDFGAHFGTPFKTNTDGRYYFAGGGVVLANGTAVFAESSFTQTSTGNVFTHVMRSTDGGTTWTQSTVAVTPEQPTCTAGGCPVDYYGTIPALAADANGKLVLTYTGPTVAKGPQRAYALRSSDNGVTWSAPVDVAGPAGANSNFTAIAGRGNGDFRMFFMDDRNGVDNWNTWYRTSSDGGATWSAEVDISDATSGPSYVHPTGFGEPYGDYGEIAITAAGKAYATWGEGPDYTGPGGVWINHAL
jgi:hypothetical protein